MKRETDMMDAVVIIFLVALAVSLVGLGLSIWGLIEQHNTTSTTVSLTEEEMQNRPLMVSSSVSVIETETSISNLEEVIEPGHKEIPLDLETQQFMEMVCKEYRVSYAFALAIMESETHFKWVDGDSHKSIGYMQINECNWYKYGLDAHFEYDNIEIGVRILSELIQKYDDTDMVIMAYKGGESFANNWAEQNKRLDACDEIIDRTLYWVSVLDGETNDDNIRND